MMDSHFKTFSGDGIELRLDERGFGGVSAGELRCGLSAAPTGSRFLKASLRVGLRKPLAAS